MSYIIHTGSNLDVLPTLPNNSIDAIVTDPPYELGFMGKSWDSTGIAYNVALWKECLRVLKPGGHILAFSGSRTYHRMTCAIEDAGFNVRDQMMWVYGSGFPKSLNIGKALDKVAGIERKVIGQKQPCGMFSPDVPHFGSASDVIETYKTSPITAPATEAAKHWDGWGTALKPAHEPICLARKPIEGTVADNVLKWGVGGLNIVGCRVPHDEDLSVERSPKEMDTNGQGWGFKSVSSGNQGRWPANLMHDGSQQVLDLFPQTHGAGTFRSGSSRGNIFSAKKDEGKDKQRQALDNGGSAARFFYCPKASKADRNEGCEKMEGKTFSMSGRDSDAAGDIGLNRAVHRKNFHPTVKPTGLMRYLCRLITPPNGTVLDPFNGSGSTGKAAVLEGFNYVGIELNPDYVAIAEARISGAITK